MEPPTRPAEAGPLLPPRDVESRGPLGDVFLELAERLLRAGRPPDVALALVESVVTAYGFPRAAFLGNVSGRLGPLATHGAVEEAVGVGSSPLVQRAHEQSATQVLECVDSACEPWLTRVVPPGSDVVVVPLRVGDQALGAVVLQLPTTLRDQQGRCMLREVEQAARYAALALDRVQRLAQLQRLAATDDLTMIANRRSLLESLNREVARSVRRGEPVSLVMLDLDHFKQINDVHGHPAGDEALRNVAAALTIASRHLDTPGRYGGEEFAVVLPDCDAERSVLIADRLRAAVSAAPAAAPLTASAGVASLPAHADDADQLILAADDALLAAKRSGRNRTVGSTGLSTRRERAGFGAAGKRAGRSNVRVAPAEPARPRPGV